MDQFSSTDRLLLFRLLVEQANEVAAARRETSRFFLTFNTAAFGALGYALSRTAEFPLPLILALSAGMALSSLFWFRLVIYYGRIVSAKFEVIMKVEKCFEIQPYKLEEEKVWKKRSPLFGATVIESAIPMLFLFGYAAIVVLLLPQIDWSSVFRSIQPNH